MAFKSVPQSEVKPGTVLIRQGYEWVVDEASYHPPTEPGRKGCYRFKCHWSGNGANPHFFNDDFLTGQREDLPITIKTPD